MLKYILTVCLRETDSVYFAVACGARAALNVFFISTTVLWLVLTIINTMIARHIVMHYSFLSVSDYPLPFDNHHTQMCLDYKQ